MTTEKDDLQDRIAAQGQARVNSDSRTQDAWGDVSGTYPQYGQTSQVSTALLEARKSII